MTIAQDAIASQDAAKESSIPPASTARSGSWLHALLIDGPDTSTGTSFWDTLLNWPARWLLVLGFTLVGLIWARFPLGVQLGWALNYGLLAGVSIAASVWVWLMVANLALAGLWLLSSWRKPLSVAARSSTDVRSPTWDVSDSITWLNRQVGHIEALAVWTALAFVTAHELTYQLLGFSALLLLAEPCLNGIARWELARHGQPDAPHAAVMIARRKWIYAATFLGFFWLSALAWRQALTLVPLFLTVLPGIVLRLVRAALRKRQTGGNEAHQQTRLALAERQRRAAPVADALFGPGLALVMTAALCVGSFLEQQHLRSRAPGKAPSSQESTCGPNAAGPETSTLAVMLLADSQIHTLGGARFPGQLELADTLVPVALRPVELDMLSSAATTRVAQVYRKRKEQREEQHLAPPLWAHLGDFADLGCADEMNRALRVLERGFGAGPALAGLAPGNHDSNFTGDFAWSPFWDSACDPSAGEAATSPGRLDKPRADRWLARLLPGAASSAETRAPGTPLSESKAIAGFTVHWPFYQDALARITVTHLGLLPAADATGPRGVVAVFLDSSDRRENDFGIPGMFGAFSARQAQEVHASVERLRGIESDQGPWKDPWFVLFMHHPYGELTGPSRGNFNDLVKALNHEGSPGPARVLALISAHTHTAAANWHDVGSHKLREVVVGSLIDPPQQAAWLEIGLDAQGQAALRVSSLPTVARAGRTCGSDDAVDAGVCQRAMARLAGAPECRALLADTADISCEKLERTLSLSQRLDALSVNASVDDPTKIRADQDERAGALLQCITRPSSPACPQFPVDPALLEHPLANEAYAPVIEALAADDCQPTPAEPSHQQELACLAWAASAMQAHKANGMTMASAIRCAFDDPSLPAAQVAVATEER